jgi:TonB-linked SusC/RagA family outer membrane protein
MKNLTKPVGDLYPHVEKLLLIMRLSVLLILIAVFSSTASVYSQATKLTIKMENARLSEVFDAIEKQSEFYFFYNRDYFNDDRIVSVDVENKLVNEVLKELLKGEAITWEIFDRNILLRIPEAPLTTAQQEVMQQQPAVSGTVTDEYGQPLPGVTVVVKGTMLGTVTNAVGEYALRDIPEDATLQFSFVGMRTEEVEVGNQSTINITMVVDAIGLEEVVAVGYGTVRKRDLTGAVAKVDMEEKSTLINVSPVQALRGSIAGVNITDNGRLGSDGSIIIRGQASISANNSPLIILDGIPYSGTLSDINSNDIQSIDVLKDASSSAIYGSRAANGVIIITTKRGKIGKPLISINSYFGKSSYGHRPDLLDGPGYIQRLLDSRSKEGLAADPNNVVEYLQPLEVENYINGKETNMWDLISQDAPMMNHELSFSGSSNNATYYISGSFADQKGVLIGDQFKRYTFRSNVESTITSWLKIGVNSSYSHRDHSGNLPNLGRAWGLSPYATIYKDENRKDLYYYPINDSQFRNPLIEVFYSDNLDIRQNFFINLFTEIQLPLNFEYRANYANTLNWSKDFNYNQSKIFPEEGINILGDGSRNHSESSNWIFENILKWNKSLDDHLFDFTFLFGLEHFDRYSSILSSDNIWNDALGYNGLEIGQNQRTVTSARENSTISSMARINYRYKEKYLLTGTVRRDGYSAFGSGNKYGTFPSVAIGWNISEEDFLKDNTWLDYLKLRYSLGKNGNQAISDYASLSKLSTNYYVFGDGSTSEVGLYTSSMANSNLGWESTWASNFGVDIVALSNRITGTFEYYIMNTKDLLLQRTLPIMTGFNSIWQNIGATKNVGFEATLNTVNVDKKDFRWNSTLTFSTNKNQITKLVGDTNGDGKEDDIIASGWFIGHSINANYDYEIDGIYQVEDEMPDWASPGYAKLVDKNNNGEIDSEDRSVLHNDDPDFRLGILNSFKWKSFSLDVFINSQKGGMRANNAYITYVNTFWNRNELDFEYWTPENRSNKYPTPFYINTWNHRIYQSRSFIRLQDVSLSYTLPSNIISRFKVENMRFYISGKNLHTVTKWSNWDPEIGDNSKGSYGPMPKSWVLGLNLTL